MNNFFDALTEISVRAVVYKAYGLSVIAVQRLRKLLFLNFLGQSLSFVFTASIIGLCGLNFLYYSGYVIDLDLVNLGNLFFSVTALISFSILIFSMRFKQLENLVGLDVMRKNLELHSMEKNMIELLKDAYKSYNYNDQSERIIKIEKSLAAVKEALEGLDLSKSHKSSIDNVEATGTPHLSFKN